MAMYSLRRRAPRAPYLWSLRGAMRPFMFTNIMASESYLAGAHAKSGLFQRYDMF